MDIMTLRPTPESPAAVERLTATVQATTNWDYGRADEHAADCLHVAVRCLIARPYSTDEAYKLFRRSPLLALDRKVYYTTHQTVTERKVRRWWNGALAVLATMGVSR